MSNADAGHSSNEIPAASKENVEPHPTLVDHVLSWSSLASEEQLLNHALDVTQDRSDLYQKLLEVARNHQGKPAPLGEVSCELVETILLHEFGQTGDLWNLNATAREVARTIVAMPDCQKRLEQLWSRLNEAIR